MKTLILDSLPNVDYHFNVPSVNTSPSLRQKSRGRRVLGRAQPPKVYVRLSDPAEKVKDLLKVSSTDNDETIQKGYETLTEDFKKKDDEAVRLNTAAFEKAARDYFDQPEPSSSAKKEASPPPVTIPHIPTAETANLAAAATPGPSHSLPERSRKKRSPVKRPQIKKIQPKGKKASKGTKSLPKKLHKKKAQSYFKVSR